MSNQSYSDTCSVFSCLKLILSFFLFISVERFHLHLKVVVGARDDLSGERPENLSMISGTLSKRDNIWIHIESRHDEEESANNKNNNIDKVLETPEKNLASKFITQSKENHTIRSNTSEIRLVRKTESVSEKKSDNSSVLISSTGDETPTTKPTFEDYKVSGWPPEVSRNVTHYVNLESKNSPILKPKLGPIISKSKMGS
jgi:hypothetical protein